MRNKFDEQLHRLEELLTQMGELCETAIAKATQALKDGSIEQAKIIIAEDEEIDQLEKDIERLCLKLLLQQQPGEFLQRRDAGDLRPHLGQTLRQNGGRHSFRSFSRSRISVRRSSSLLGLGGALGASSFLWKRLMAFTMQNTMKLMTKKFKTA